MVYNIQAIGRIVITIKISSNFLIVGNAYFLSGVTVVNKWQLNKIPRFPTVPEVP